jgi:hypothetical protein
VQNAATTFDMLAMCQFDRNPLVARPGSSFTWSLQPYKQLLPKLSHAFLERLQYLGNPNADDLSTMEFWLLKYPLGDDDAPARNANITRDYMTYFLYQDSNQIDDENGNPIAMDRTGRLVIRLERAPSRTAIRVYWRDSLGLIKSMEVSKLQKLNSKKLSTLGLNGQLSIDNSL